LAADGLLFIEFKAQVPAKSTFLSWALIIAGATIINTTANDTNRIKSERFFFIVFEF